MAKAPAAIMVHGSQSMPAWDFFRPLSRIVNSLQGPEIAASYSSSIGASWTEICEFTIAGIENFLGDQGKKTLLLMVAMHANMRQATNPRDRIYAFYGMSADCDPSDSELEPKYGASVEEVYARFARWCLIKNKDLVYLGYAGLSDQHAGHCIEDRPSWVADWSQDWRVHFSYTWSNQSSPGYPGSYKAGSALKPTILWSHDQPRFLNIKGRVVDKVVDLSVARIDLLNYDLTVNAVNHEDSLLEQLITWAVYDYGLNPGPGFQQARQAISKYGPMKGPDHMLVDVIWMENCKAIATQGVSPMTPTRFDAFWRTMSRNQGYQGSSEAPPYFAKMFEEYLEFLDLVRDGKRIPCSQPGTKAARFHKNFQGISHKDFAKSIGTSALSKAVARDESELEMRRILHTYWEGILHRRFCSTTEGRLGWVPDCAEPGDLICIFDGAAVPYVIRPRADKVPGKLSFAYWHRQLFGNSSQPLEARPDPEYVLVGECYVQGLMEGEALADADSKSRLITLS